MTNHVDRFFTAVSVLAGDGHIKQRLARAFQDNLAELEDEELPIAIREAFMELRRRMQCVAPSNGEGPIWASVRKMSAVEASECAVAVVSLYTDVLKHLDAFEDALPGAVEQTEIVPAFLMKSVS